MSARTWTLAVVLATVLLTAPAAVVWLVSRTVPGDWLERLLALV